jgi:hypothetical protein
LTDFGIHLDPSDLNPNFACGNFMWGLIYVGVGLIIALIGESDEIGPVALKKIGRYTGLTPDKL